MSAFGVPAQAIDATQALNPPASKAAGYIAALIRRNTMKATEKK